MDHSRPRALQSSQIPSTSLLRHGRYAIRAVALEETVLATAHSGALEIAQAIGGTVEDAIGAIKSKLDMRDRDAAAERRNPEAPCTWECVEIIASIEGSIRLDSWKMLAENAFASDGWFEGTRIGEGGFQEFADAVGELMGAGGGKDATFEAIACREGDAWRLHPGFRDAVRWLAECRPWR